MFKKFLSDPYNRIIVLLVKENRTQQEETEIKQLIEELDKVELFDTAKRHEVCSIMYPTLKMYYQNAEWEKEYLKTKEQLQWMLQRTQDFAKKLYEKNIPLIVLKNAGIAMAFMSDYGKCPMGDVDTLVKKTHFFMAHETAVEDGFVFKFRSVYENENLEEAFADGSTEYSYNSSNRSMWLEIAWRAVAGRWINRKNEPKTERLFKDAVYIEDKGVYILSPEDNLLQVSIHTAKHSYVRKPGFRLHLDVERIVNYCNIDWNIFIRKTREANTKTAVYFSLVCARDLFGISIPDYVIKALKPFALKRYFITKIIEHNMELHGKAKKMGKIEFIIFQMFLYDDLKDVLSVAFPGGERLKKKYPEYNFIKAQILHILDLIGIRKEKQKSNEK